jgi:hypothetical protein
MRFVRSGGTSRELLPHFDADRMHTLGVVLFVVPSQVQQAEQRENGLVFCNDELTFQDGLETVVTI